MDVLGTDERIVSALTSLTQIGAAINQIEPGGSTSIEETLCLITRSAIQVVPGASSVIYIYDHVRQAFDPSTRVSAGESRPPDPTDAPRPDGIGSRAIRLRRRLLSYEENTPEIHPIKVEAGAKALVCFPLIVADNPVGALYVYLHDDRVFSEIELFLLENFVNQAAMAIHHSRQVSRIRRDLSRREEEATRLRRASLLISSRPHLNETLEAILQMALDVTDAEYGNFWLVDKSGEYLKMAAMVSKGSGHPHKDDIRLSQTSVTSWVANHRQAICIPDLNDGFWASIYLPFDRSLEMRSELAVPLIGASGRLEGVLNLESPAVNAFTEEDSLLLQALATQAVTAIQDVLLLDALKGVTERLITKPCRDVLMHLTSLAAELLNATASAIWLVEGDELMLVASNPGHEHDNRVPIHSSLVGQVIVQREPVISNDVRNDPRFYRQDLARAQKWTRALILPITTAEGRQPVGAFSVFGVVTEPGRFAESDWDRKVLTILADYVALAVLNESHQEQLRDVQAQRYAAETFAALGDVAANLLHQLNNKMGTIPVRIEGIQDKSRAALEVDPYLAKNLDEIGRSAREAMRVVHDNMALMQPIQLVAVDLLSSIHEALAIAGLPSGVQVEIADFVDLPPVMAGIRSLPLIFTNLLENAASAMQGSGRVSLSGFRQDDWVIVEVSDTGPGIASDLHGRIFEFNYSSQGEGQAGKLGFGLWWTKTMMARLGGKISVESDGQQGATFRLKFPVSVEALGRGDGGE
jgi:signal transduction histidine kinase/putative methionine-R-sulfoxide reductase with GAF domain